MYLRQPYLQPNKPAAARTPGQVLLQEPSKLHSLLTCSMSLRRRIWKGLLPSLRIHVLRSRVVEDPSDCGPLLATGYCDLLSKQVHLIFWRKIISLFTIVFLIILKNNSSRHGSFIVCRKLYMSLSWTEYSEMVLSRVKISFDCNRLIMADYL